MTASEIAKQRLVNQQISTTTFKKPDEIVAWLGAMQAQEYTSSKWAIGLRLHNIHEADIDQAFNDGAILRTHLLRPTWHFVTPADIRWMLALTAPRIKAANAFMNRKLELDNTVLKRSNDTLAKSLEGGKQLTRTELKTKLEKKKIIADGLRLGYIMAQAELDGIICSGPKQGKQFTHALLEERVPPVKHLNKDEALAELSKRYFSSRGPATLKDFSTWSGLSSVDVKAGLSMVKSHFIQEKFNNEDYYFLPSVSINNEVQNTYLLPIYDEYIMGYKNRSAILDFNNKIKPPPKFLFDHTIIIAGQIVGTWRRTIHNKSIDLEFNLFKPLSKTQHKKFEFAVDQFSSFMKLPVTKVEIKYLLVS